MGAFCMTLLWPVDVYVYARTRVNVSECKCMWVWVVVRVWMDVSECEWMWVSVSGCVCAVISYSFQYVCSSFSVSSQLYICFSIYCIIFILFRLQCLPWQYLSVLSGSALVVTRQRYAETDAFFRIFYFLSLYMLV